MPRPLGARTSRLHYPANRPTAAWVSRSYVRAALVEIGAPSDDETAGAIALAWREVNRRAVIVYVPDTAPGDRRLWVEWQGVGAPEPSVILPRPLPSPNPTAPTSTRSE